MAVTGNAMDELEEAVGRTCVTTPIFDGIAGDLTIRTDQDVIQVHKSVMMSCPYFAAAIQGDWLESRHSTITLGSFNHKTVWTAVAHLYRPTDVIDEKVDLLELTVLADMLGLHQLLDTVIATITSKHCHNFHKPCRECIVGVFQTLQLSSTYNLTALKDHCFGWQARYFSKTWNSRPFAALNPSLQHQCLQCITASMTANNVLDVMVRCQLLRDTLPGVKWADPVKSLADELLVASSEWLKSNFDLVLQSTKFQSLRTANQWDMARLENVLVEAAQGLSDDQCCSSYRLLGRALQDADEESPPLLELQTKLHQSVEARLAKRVAMATRCAAWKTLDKDVQGHVMRLGHFDPMDDVVPAAARIRSAPVRANGNVSGRGGSARALVRRPNPAAANSAVVPVRRPSQPTATNDRGMTRTPIR